MSSSLDEQTAWNLLRALPRGAPTAPIRVHHDYPLDAWLQVDVSGAWATSAPATDEARQLLEIFLPLLLDDPFVVAQAGQSVDGRMATETGHSHYVTGPADIRRLHQLRALVDAVVVGAGTVAADNPRLTVRAVEGEHPARVVLDPDGRLDPHSHVFVDGLAPTIVVRRDTADLRSNGGSCAVLRLPMTDRGFDPHVLVAALRTKGYRRVLVEGGATTVSRFLQAGALDRLHITIAPLVIGSGPQALTLDPITTLESALRPPCRHFHLGDDILFDFDLRHSTGRRTQPE